MSHHQKPITLKTLATILGYTPATISKALRDSTDISEKTRQIVKDKAEELGYHPNIMARSLIKRRSHILGVIVPDLGHSFFADLTRGIYEKARSYGYESIIMVHDESAKIEKRNLQFLAALNVDGLLIASVPSIKNNEIILRIQERGIPFVCFDRLIDGLKFNSVTIDDQKASEKLMEYIIKDGRKDIVFIGPLKDLFVARGRYKGYVEILKKYGMQIKPEYILECKTTEESAYSKMVTFIKSGRKFDAVMCVSGLIAFGVGKAILEAGLSIPGDVLLTEFGDNNVVHRLGVPFVTIDQFPYEMGEKSLELIVKLIERKDEVNGNEHIYVDTRLVVHHSINHS
jgi:DNA-binding LacI/PurR family transcriptional regulator